MKQSTITTIILVLVVIVAVILIFGGGGNQTADQPATTTDPEATTTQATTTSSQSDTNTPPATTQNESPSTTTTPSDEQTTESTTTNASAQSKAAVTVTYTRNGFSPQTVEVTQGDTVRFVNESGTDMWVGSDRHPTHTQYAGTSLRDHCPEGSDEAFDQCEAGDTYSFTFDKAGTWSYHNHLQASDGGTVVVE